MCLRILALTTLLLFTTGCGVYNALSTPPEEEGDPDVGLDAGPDADVEPDPDADVTPDLDADTEPDPDTGSDADPAPDTGPDADAEPDPDTGPDADTEPDTGPECECDPGDGESYQCIDGTCDYQCEEGWSRHESSPGEGCDCRMTSGIDEFPKCPGLSIDDSVFVDADPERGSDEASGLAPDEPLHSLDEAVKTARDEGLSIIWLAASEAFPYELSETLDFPVSLYGGRLRSQDWQHDWAAPDWDNESDPPTLSVIQSASFSVAEDFVDENLAFTMRVERSSGEQMIPATFSGLDIRPPDTPGGSDIEAHELWGLSVATVHITGVTEGGLTIENTRIRGGTAVDGRRGSDGDDGDFDAFLMDGKLGQEPTNHNWDQVFNGGIGGESSCISDGGAGGESPGRNTTTQDKGGDGDSGQNTSTALGGPGGTGGDSQTLWDSNSPEPEPGEPGEPGEHGDDGDGGNAAEDAAGQFNASGQWEENPGAAGEPGEHGTGGGGGGGGGSIYYGEGGQDYGGPGGGGGAGGCGGEGGGAGQAGGASFAVILFQADVYFDGVVVTGGSAGEGGDGGDGGCGRSGGAPGPARAGFEDAEDGGDGGPGGAGGDGGAGSGGHGGPLVGVALVGSNMFFPGGDSTQFIDYMQFSDSKITQGGAPGTSCDPSVDTTAGEQGAAGIVEHTQEYPTP